ncbi:class F sortase [Nocardioides sp. Kera G14]|uniref:class F sortase n=1 Tax=Nocardioides sp. Kera G14 TaxID=2884264 RepID=UPI001D10D53C|nr:class F sortase [Nocardioides sp. Kera G14]UDY25112.1 class F sortase [Nocardioides sp. Kera G14]
MTRLRLLALLAVVALAAICLDPVRAATLGHGRAPSKGFSGYVSRDGAELGVGRLPNGVRGICLDTGTSWTWPDKVPASHLVNDPVVGYLTSTYLPRAAKDPVLAAALWWAVGERLNSHPLKVSGHVALMRNETPKLAHRIVAAHATLVNAALRWAPTVAGYAAMKLALTRGDVSGIGVRSATGHWVPGLPVVVTVQGAQFANGGTTWRGTTDESPLRLPLSPDGAEPVSVAVHVSRLPAARFRLYDPMRDHRQRVAASAGPGTMAASAELAFVPAQPRLATTINTRQATEGATLVDRVAVSGLSDVPGSGPVTGEWQLVGPTRPDRNATCRGAAWAGAPLAGHGTFTVTRSGTVAVGATRIQRGGCYTYRERLIPTAYNLGVPWTPLGIVAETAVVGPAQPRVPGHPLVNSGGESDGTPETSDRRTPARIRLGAVGLNTTLSGVTFHGSTITPPHAISTGGIWREGAPVDALVGTTVVVGHVSDNHDRPGAFKRLQKAKRGQVIELTSPAGVRTAWRITNIKAVDRARLPRSIFGQGVQRRLVLVTCTDKVTYANGGFHYRKNLIVTAEPA